MIKINNKIDNKNKFSLSDSEFDDLYYIGNMKEGTYRCRGILNPDNYAYIIISDDTNEGGGKVIIGLSSDNTPNVIDRFADDSWFEAEWEHLPNASIEISIKEN